MCLMAKGIEYFRKSNVNWLYWQLMQTSVSVYIETVAQNIDEFLLQIATVIPIYIDTMGEWS